MACLNSVVNQSASCKSTLKILGVFPRHPFMPGAERKEPKERMRERSNSNKPTPRPVARRRPGRIPNGPLKARLADDRSAKPNDLEITYVAIEAIREYKNHARVHNKKVLAKAKALLSAHGQIVPIVIDQNGEILDGVLRYRALRKLGA